MVKLLMTVLNVHLQFPLSNCFPVGFGTGFTDESENPVIGNHQRSFSKHSAQPIILRTDLNQLIRMFANFWVSVGRFIVFNFLLLKRGFGSNKRWSMVNYNF